MCSYMGPTSVKPDKVSGDEMACIYAALILADDDIPITPDKISTLLTAANCNVDSIWPSLYAKALSGINIREYVTAPSNFGGSGGYAGLTTAATPGSTVPGSEAPAKEEKKPAPQEDEEDSDEDFGLGLFD